MGLVSISWEKKEKKKKNEAFCICAAVHEVDFCDLLLRVKYDVLHDHLKAHRIAFISVTLLHVLVITIINNRSRR